MRLNILLLFLLPFLVLSAIEVRDVPNVHVQDRTRYVTDQGSMMNPQTVRQLDTTLGDLWRRTSAEVVVVTIDKLPDDSDIDTYATELFQHWGVGKSDNDNGLLLLVSRDDKKVAVRTGYGIEGAIPDVVAGRIIRNTLTPRFRQGDYDGGIAAAVNQIGAIITDPQLADELMSKQKNDQIRPREEVDVWGLYLWVAFFAACGMMVFILWEIWSSRKQNEVLRYRQINSWAPVALAVAFLTLGMGFLPYGIMRWKLHRLRRHKRLCPHCQSRLRLIDEEHDNLYLTPAQDTEERIGSVDYDVWECPQCHTTEILPYHNPKSRYTDCQRCGSRAVSLVDTSTLVPATTHREGIARDTYVCRNCGNQTHNDRRTPRKPDPTMAAAAAAAGLAAGGRGGGGGFGGGSFGGGSTGGGGASGGW